MVANKRTFCRISLAIIVTGDIVCGTLGPANGQDPPLRATQVALAELIAAWKSAKESIKRQITSCEVNGSVLVSQSPEIKFNGQSVPDHTTRWRALYSGDRRLLDVVRSGKDFEWNPIRDLNVNRDAVSFDGKKWYRLSRATPPSPQQIAHDKIPYPWTADNPAPPRGYVDNAPDLLKRMPYLPYKTLRQFEPYWFRPEEFLANPLNTSPIPAEVIFPDVENRIRAGATVSPDVIDGQDALRLDVKASAASAKMAVPLESVWFIRQEKRWLPYQFRGTLSGSNLRVTATFTSGADYQGTWYPTGFYYRAETPPGKEGGQWEIFSAYRYKWTLTRINEAIPDEEFRIAFPAYASVVFENGTAQNPAPFPNRPFISNAVWAVIIAAALFAMAVVALFLSKERRANVV